MNPYPHSLFLSLSLSASLCLFLCLSFSLCVFGRLQLLFLLLLHASFCFLLYRYVTYIFNWLLNNVSLSYPIASILKKIIWITKLTHRADQEYIWVVGIKIPFTRLFKWFVLFCFILKGIQLFGLVKYTINDVTYIISHYVFCYALVTLSLSLSPSRSLSSCYPHNNHHHHHQLNCSLLCFVTSDRWFMHLLHTFLRWHQ